MAEVPAVHVSTQWTPEGVVVAVSGEIDRLTAPVLGATFDALVGAGHREVVFDLAAVTFADAACLAVIAAAATRLRSVDGVFLLRSPRPMARRLLAVSELEGFIESPTRDVATFRSARPSSSRSDAERPVEAHDIHTRAAWTFGRDPRGGGDLLAAARVSNLLDDTGVDATDESIVPHMLGALQSRTVIAQAQGVIMARFGVSAETAFAALSRSSEASGTPIGERAGEIISGTLRKGLIGEMRI